MEQSWVELNNAYLIRCICQRIHTIWWMNADFKQIHKTKYSELYAYSQIMSTAFAAQPFTTEWRHFGLVCVCPCSMVLFPHRHSTPTSGTKKKKHNYAKKNSQHARDAPAKRVILWVQTVVVLVDGYLASSQRRCSCILILLTKLHAIPCAAQPWKVTAKQINQSSETAKSRMGKETCTPFPHHLYIVLAL